MKRAVTPTGDPSRPRRCLALAGGWLLVAVLLAVSFALQVLPLLLWFDALAVP